jgi:hypothetical protein
MRSGFRASRGNGQAYFIDGESDISNLLGTVVRYPVTAVSL